jgi:exonuclease III
VVVGDFNTSLSTIDILPRQKINKEFLEIKDTISLMELTDIFIIFHPATVQYTFFSEAHRTFSKLDHILGLKAILIKYKNIEITSCILSDHNAMKLVINNKSNSRECSNNWRLNNTLINGHWIIETIR